MEGVTAIRPVFLFTEMYVCLQCTYTIEFAMSKNERDKRQEFEEIALPHMESLYRGALHMATVQHEAEELVQETYLKAYKAFESFKRGTNCKAWLFTILRNLLINGYRRNKKTPVAVGNDQIETFSFYDNAVSHKVLDTDLTREPEKLKELLEDEVNDALEGLPDDFREVIILSDIEGLTYKEISEVIQSPVGTVKSRLYRARSGMQKSLWDYAVKKGLVKE